MKGVDCSRHAVDRDAERVQTPSKARQNPSEVNSPRRLGQQPVANGERIRQQRGVEPIILEPAQVQGRRSARGRGRERSRNALEHGANVGPSGTGYKSKLQDVRSQRFPYKRWRPRERTSLPLFKKAPRHFLSGLLASNASHLSTVQLVLMSTCTQRCIVDVVGSGFALHLGRAGETDPRKPGRLRSRSKQYSSYLSPSLAHAGTAALGTIENRPELFDDAEIVARLHEALLIGGVGVWSWDLGAEVIAADPVARRLWGLPKRGRILTSHVLKAIHSDDVSSVRSAVLSAQLPGLCDVEFRLRRLDHEIRWMRVRGSISRTLGKSYAAGVAIDI